jgi:hypothetical protein
VSELCLAGRLKLVRHGWVLLHQYVIAAKPVDAALYRDLSFRSFRFGLARDVGITVLSQKKTARKQQSQTQLIHGDFSLLQDRMATLWHELA